MTGYPRNYFNSRDRKNLYATNGQAADGLIYTVPTIMRCIIRYAIIKFIYLTKDLFTVEAANLSLYAVLRISS